MIFLCEACIFRYHANIDSQGYVLPWSFYTLCKISKTLEIRKEGRTEWDCVMGMVEDVKGIPARACSLTPIIHCCAKRHLVFVRRWMKLVIWLLPALLFTLFSYAILQMKIEAVKRAIIPVFSTLNKVFLTRAQMAFYQSPNSALHSLVPMGQNMCCLKWQFS